MIVFDASTIVGVALRQDSVPERALRRALALQPLALSLPVNAEYVEVLGRPKFVPMLVPGRRDEILALVRGAARWFVPAIRVTDCRDAKDNKYLELALAAGADVIVSSDDDLLVLHPWRGIPILRPAEYLAAAGGSGGVP